MCCCINTCNFTVLIAAEKVVTLQQLNKCVHPKYMFDKRNALFPCCGLVFANSMQGAHKLGLYTDKCIAH